MISEFTQSLLYDRRDSRINPTEGYFGRMSNDLAGLGGDTHYLRNRFDAGKYIPLGKAREWILSVTGSVGYIVGLGEDVRFIDRFFMGGEDVRGFATAGIGPRDITTDDALGGEWMYRGTVELKVPLGVVSEFGITGRLFTDIGGLGGISSSSTDVNDTGTPRASVGVGLSWVSPFGPIGLDFGFPMIKEDFDRTETIRLNFGTKF